MEEKAGFEGYFNHALWGVFALAALVILAVPFPPMQDLPQHLFQVKAWTTFNDPAYNWKDFYRLSFIPGPYNLPYMLIALFSFAMPIVWAAKAFLVLCLLLYLFLIVLVRRTKTKLLNPWPLLLAFPLFFQHIYYYGTLAVLIGVVLSLIAANDLNSLAGRGEAATGRLRWLVLALLLFSHPFCIAAYATIAGAIWLREFWRGGRSWFLLIGPGALLAAYGAWHLLVFAPSVGAKGAFGGFGWAPQYFKSYPVVLLLPFTGMKYNGGVDWPSTFGWLAVTVMAILAFLRAEGTVRRAFCSLLALAGAWVVLYFCLPYSVGDYAVFNLRALPYAYWFLILALTSLPPLPRAGGAFALIAAALLLPIYLKTASLSRNIGDAVDLLKDLKPNQAMLRQVFDGRVSEVDPGNFFVYSHVDYYYHVLVGGGFNPYLAYNTMWPVTYLPTVPEEVKEPRLVRMLENGVAVGYYWKKLDNSTGWERHYDYLLLLDATDDFMDFLNPNGVLPTRSAGRFTLLARDASLLP